MSRSKHFPLFITGVLLVFLAADTVAAQRGRGGGRRSGGSAPEEAAKERSDGIKPYDEVVTEDFVADPGLFLVHQGAGEKEGKVYYEIPESALNKDMLWVSQLAQTQAGFGYGGTGIGDRVVRWEMRGNKILLRDIKFTIRGEEDDSISTAVKATSVAPIIDTFEVMAWGKDKAAVIDVSDLFLGDTTEFSAARRLNASGVDSKRTFIEEVKSFPSNVETKVLKTYRLSSGRDGASSERRGQRGTRRDPSQSAVTVLMHYSMVLLPEEPMRPRQHDDRVGFFSVSFDDFNGQDHSVERERYITRWRLEKQDPSAEVSEPVKPIVFYVGRGVPEKWRPWVAKGIEMWQPAFEAAGFKNAILAKDAPSPKEDPDWDAEDARYSTIRWLPSTIENAMGPHVNDPRTGEILEADILMYHNVLKLVRDWYFIQASPSDPEAQTLPLPDDTVGAALAYVVAHEVGHSLGFPHNMKASSAYTVDQLRDPEFTAKYGTEASIMDYGRFNYVAQPGDGAALIPVVGPYDYFAVEWGYKSFRPREEKAELAKIVSRQKTDPMLRFGNPNAGEDPSQQTEDLGSDPILATRLGLKNLDRVASYLVQATCKEGEDYSLLRNMYDELFSQRNRELGHVAAMVGGFVRNNAWYGDSESQYVPVSASRQASAVGFLLLHAFATPHQLLDTDITMRLETNGAADRVLSSQRRLLTTLISKTRVDRMAEQANLFEDSYAPADMLADLRNGLWLELKKGLAIDLYRRNLQRTHIEILSDVLQNESSDSDLPALARWELRSILHKVSDYKPQNMAPDALTMRHLNDIQARIRTALNPDLEKGSRLTVPASGAPVQF